MNGYTSVFMGDVIIPASTGLAWYIEILTDDGGSDFYWSGSYANVWFASPLQVVLHAIESFNAATGEQVTVGMVTDPDDSDFGKIQLTGYTTDIDFGFGGADHEWNTILGITGSSAYSNSATLTFDTPPDSFFGPVWPIPEYTRGVKAIGKRDVAADGSIYTHTGMYQETRNLGVQLDRRDNDFTEFEKWRLLWEERWRVGRSVTFYPNSDSLPSGIPSTGDYLVVGSADVLVIDAPRELMATMLIPHKQMTDVQQTTQFYVKMPEPLNAGDWGQGFIQY